jgi:hypothetical protein
MPIIVTVEFMVKERIAEAMRFMITDINDHDIIGLNPVTESRAGMIEILRRDVGITELKGTLAEITKMVSGRQAVQVHREKRWGHLHRKSLPQ